MLRRPKLRIDYKKLNSTGAVVIKDTDTELSRLFADNCTIKDNEMAVALKIEIQVMCSDIMDTIDENPINETMDTDVLKNLEHQRSTYKHKNLQLQTMEPDDFDANYQTSYQKTLSVIKEYIKASKDFNAKTSLADVKVKHEIDLQQNRSLMFLAEDIERSISNLTSMFSQNVSDGTDEDLVMWKKEIGDYSKQFERVAERYQDLLTHHTTNPVVNEAVKALNTRYVSLSSIKASFIKSLKIEYNCRELYKQTLFNETNLNIKLDKFSGYDSCVDVYTFQSNFEKVYLRTTPKRLVPDLLLNNYLCEPALSLVKGLEDADQIWKRLKQAYGDTKVMLSKKLNQISKLESLSKTKDPEKVIYILSKLINSIKDLIRIAKEHNITDRLHYGDGLQRICKLLDDGRVTRWMASICDDDLDEADQWKRLLLFLEKELKLQQQKLLINGDKIEKDKVTEKVIPAKTQRYKSSFHVPPINGDPICYICDASCDNEHVPTSGPGGSKVIQYFTCKTFVHKTPAERFLLLREKGLCFQCLLPGAMVSSGKHREGKCQHDFTCRHPNHQRYQTKKHVLVCEEHKETNENIDLLERYKQRCMKNPSLPSFAREIKLSFHSDAHHVNSDETGIYLLQIVMINNQRFTVFFDNGCSDFIVKYEAAKKMKSFATQVYAGDMCISGVGDSNTRSNHGIYTVKMPLYNGDVASMSGICLDRITAEFPSYPLDKVERDIHNAFKADGGDVKRLPKLPTTIGGEVDVMIGVKYLRHHPKPIFQLPSGLCIYESVFVDPTGGRGVIGGPHEIFSKIHSTLQNSNEKRSFFVHQYERAEMGFNVDPDVSLLGFKEFHGDLAQVSDCPQPDNYNSFHSKAQRLFQQVEESGSQINYRCINCRECKTCKHHEEIEAISLKEEVEQDIINNSVKVDTSNNIITASLPFIHDPTLKLPPNRDRAMKVYNQQLRKLNNPFNVKDKKDIIESEQKLQNLGFVDYVKNLPTHTQGHLKNHLMQHFIPWRAVWKASSISTPCRIVFDASQATSSGFSLNDLLAKGRNNLNRLQDIILRWSTHKIGITTDIKKMYNTIKLNEKDWCYQRYLWQKDLDPEALPEEKVIKTLIYGVRSSGNQSEFGLKEVAKLSHSKYPQACNIIDKDTYVDDCITGEKSKELAIRRTEEMDEVVNTGGFQLKGIAISGEDPPESLSDDCITVNVAGMIWYPKEDKISLNISELNFSKKRRGKKSTSMSNVIPQKLTRRHCASKVAEVFDITGKITPITASMKLDLHELVIRNLDWDDCIPDELRPVWTSNFEMMQEINHLKFRRAVIPEDAVDLDINTIDFADASQSLACVAIYARFKRLNGHYSCQLIFARSRIIPKGMSLPRAELYAALLNAHTGEVVRRSLCNWHKSSIKLTDSQITLHWITNDQKPLKQWVRNRVIEILRFTTIDQWFYVKTNNMIADIGTRKGKSLADVDDSSTWINGYEWMKLHVSTFPIKTPNSLIISNDEDEEIKKEKIITNESTHLTITTNQDKVPPEVQQRYQYSTYLIDPNRFRFKTVVRILAIVIKFVKKLKYLQKHKDSTTLSKKKEIPSNSSKSFITVSEEDIRASEVYFFKRCTAEIKHFLSTTKYQGFTKEVDGILIYTGRILNADDITVVGRFTNVMKDLSKSSFCVPVLDRFSPVAYAIANDIHWYHNTAKHCGVETTLRYILQTAYIIDGRSIVKSIRKSCERCRYLMKRTVSVSMGPISRHMLTIAPAFYITQTDLAGPFLSYSNHHKRTTVKIWFVVFCCATTSTTNIKTMEDYSAASFIHAFTRFSCEAGYPKILLCDEGSQLVSGCNNMKLNFLDLKHKLHQDVSIQFKVCPVGGHNEHGKVERKIKEIKSSFEKNTMKERLSIIQWETLAAQVANSINNLPLAIGSITSDLESIDLITPNRLRLGRNNDRSPEGPVTIASPTRIIKQNQKIFESWFENWMLSHVPKLLKQQKWFSNDESVKVGDVVLFPKQDGPITSDYRYGLVKNVDLSKDGLVRRVKIHYKNENEVTFRETHRSVRSIIIIHHVDETDLVEELGSMANKADVLRGNCEKLMNI